MHVIVGLVSGREFLSDKTTVEKIREQGDAETILENLEEVKDALKNYRELRYFSMQVGGVDVYFNPDNIEYACLVDVPTRQQLEAIQP